jgi:hypothetical protein
MSMSRTVLESNSLLIAKLYVIQPAIAFRLMCAKPPIHYQHMFNHLFELSNETLKVLPQLIL